MSFYVQYNENTGLYKFIEGDISNDGLKDLIKLDVDAFYRDYFDIDTCGDAGLANWGRILGLNNSYSVPNYDYVFGFGNTLPPYPDYPQNFMHGSFYGGQTKIIPFTTEQYRVLLKLKYRILTSNYSYNDIIDIINKFVQNVNPDYKFRIVQISAKKVRYEFSFFFENSELAFYQMIKDKYILPVPATVEYDVVFNQPF